MTEYNVMSVRETMGQASVGALQLFLNGWVKAEGYDVVSVLAVEGDFLVVLCKG